jgi:hypothetical protein
MAKKTTTKETKPSGRNSDGTFAEGNEYGRPALYSTQEELDKKVEEYFEWIKGEYEERTGTRTTTKKDGSSTEETYTYWFEIRPREIPSITGLAIFLGFESRQSMYDYLKKEPFSYSIKKALLKVENTYEGGLWQEKPTGAIFALKNMGWADKTETDITTKGESITPAVIGMIIK